MILECQIAEFNMYIYIYIYKWPLPRPIGQGCAETDVLESPRQLSAHTSWNTRWGLTDTSQRTHNRSQISHTYHTNIMPISNRYPTDISQTTIRSSTRSSTSMPQRYLTDNAPSSKMPNRSHIEMSQISHRYHTEVTQVPYG